MGAMVAVDEVLDATVVSVAWAATAADVLDLRVLLAGAA